MTHTNKEEGRYYCSKCGADETHPATLWVKTWMVPAEAADILATDSRNIRFKTIKDRRVMRFKTSGYLIPPYVVKEWWVKRKRRLERARR